jgi:hypothetical protein
MANFSGEADVFPGLYGRSERQPTGGVIMIRLDFQQIQLQKEFEPDRPITQGEYNKLHSINGLLRKKETLQEHFLEFLF